MLAAEMAIHFYRLLIIDHVLDFFLADTDNRSLHTFS